MKIIKIFLATLGAFVGLILLVIVCMLLWFAKDGWTAGSPSRIASEAGFKLPAYEIVQRSDNMDRTASAWSEYDYKVKLKKPLTEKQIGKLDKLVKNDSNWTTKTENGVITKYIYKDFGDEKCISIEIIPADNIVILSYSYWDVFS